VPLQGKSVLIVEDEAIIALDTKQVVEKAGAEHVFIARSVQEARALLQQNPKIDTVILDISLGSDPSFPLAESLLAAGISCIFSTGYPTHSLIPEHLGTIPILTKPYAEGELLSALAEQMANRPGNK